MAEAEVCFRNSLRLRPSDAEAHLNLAYSLLTAGRLAEGWEHHEWRWKTVIFGLRPSAPLRGRGADFLGRTILLRAEQGLGDTLQFCRYAPLIAAGGAKIVLEVQSPLVRLLSRLPDVMEVIAFGDPLPPFDLQCPLMSLPRAVGTTLETIPRASYLEADPTLSANWRKRLARLPCVKVGLVWPAGASRPGPCRHRRSSVHDVGPADTARRGARS